MNKRTPTIRLLEVIEAFCESPDTNISAISNQLDIPLPTVYRNIDNLLEAGFLAKDPADRISAGPRLRRLLYNSLARESSLAERRSLLQKLSDSIEETVSISVPRGHGLYYFDRVESHWPMRLTLNPGDKLPMISSASGKLYLSTLPNETALRIFKNEKKNQTARLAIKRESEFIKELDKIRDNEFALDNEEFFDGMVGAAVPIKSLDGRYSAFLSTHGLVARKSIEATRSEISALQECADQLTALFFSQQSVTGDYLRGAEVSQVS